MQIPFYVGQLLLCMKPAIEWLIYPVSLYERKLFFLLPVGTIIKSVVNIYLSNQVIIHSFTHSFLKNNKQNIINQKTTSSNIHVQSPFQLCRIFRICYLSYFVVNKLYCYPKCTPSSQSSHQCLRLTCTKDMQQLL